MKVGSVTVVLCSGVQMNFYSHVPYFLTDVDEIRCGRSPHMSLSSCEYMKICAISAGRNFLQGGYISCMKIPVLLMMNAGQDSNWCNSI